MRPKWIDYVSNHSGRYVILNVMNKELRPAGNDGSMSHGLSTLLAMSSDQLLIGNIHVYIWVVIISHLCKARQSVLSISPSFLPYAQVCKRLAYSSDCRTGSHDQLYPSPHNLVSLLPLACFSDYSLSLLAPLPLHHCQPLVTSVFRRALLFLQ